jgi:hypothetical protein
MFSCILKMFKTKNPHTDYPTNLGKKWTDEEENTLLQELDKNINIENIAQIHNRTIGGIRARQRTIAYNMYLKKASIEEIMIKTKLDKEQLMKIIKKRRRRDGKSKNNLKTKNRPKKISNTIISFEN